MGWLLSRAWHTRWIRERVQWRLSNDLYVAWIEAVIRHDLDDDHRGIAG